MWNRCGHEFSLGEFQLVRHLPLTRVDDETLRDVPPYPVGTDLLSNYVKS